MRQLRFGRTGGLLRFYGRGSGKAGVYVLDKVFIKPVKVEVKGVTEGEVLLSLDGKTHTLKRGLTLLSERKGREFDGDGKAFLASEAVYAEWL